MTAINILGFCTFCKKAIKECTGHPDGETFRFFKSLKRKVEEGLEPDEVKSKKQKVIINNGGTKYEVLGFIKRSNSDLVPAQPAQPKQQSKNSNLPSGSSLVQLMPAPAPHYQAQNSQQADSKPQQIGQYRIVSFREWCCPAPGCPIKYIRKGDLIRHLVSTHEGSGIFTCRFNNCGSSFKTNVEREGHEQSDHREADKLDIPGLKLCPFCNFLSDTVLDEHLRVSHSAQKYIAKCDRHENHVYFLNVNDKNEHVKKCDLLFNRIINSK